MNIKRFDCWQKIAYFQIDKEARNIRQVITMFDKMNFRGVSTTHINIVYAIGN
jgi:hypothetical protein